MKRYVYWSIVSTLMVVSIAALASQVRNYHMRYLYHKKEVSKADVYLRSQVCMDARVKANLGDFHKCDEAAHIVEISPWIAAWYDIIENWHICGHGRCELFLEDIRERVPWFIWITLAVFMYLFYLQMRQNAQMQQMAQYHIPFGYQRLQL